MLGSYFSPQGAIIQQGVGEFFDAANAPWAGAYQDGSFGHGRDYPGAGELHAYHDGSLGEFFDGAAPVARAFDEGSLGKPRGDLWTSDERGGDPGPLQAYYDGTLGRGWGPPNVGPAARVDTPPGGGAQAEAPTDAFGGGGFPSGLEPIHAFHEGILGGGCGEYFSAEQVSGLGLPLYIDDVPVDTAITIGHDPAEAGHPLHINGKAFHDPMVIRHGDDGALRAYHNGSLGAYRTRLHAYRDGSLGAVPDPKVVDLQNVSALKETRAAIAFFVPEVSMSTSGPHTGGAYFDQAFIESPIWTGKDDELWAAAITKLIGHQPTYKEGDLSQSSSGHHFPTPLGLSVILALGVGAPTGPQGPTWFPSTFPILSAFLMAVTANKGSTSGFSVREPFFSTTELVRGGKATFAGMSTSTLALAGLGVAAAVAAAVVWKKKKRA